MTRMEERIWIIKRELESPCCGRERVKMLMRELERLEQQQAEEESLNENCDGACA